MSDDKKKIAVVLFQLGGPDSLAAVEPFLYNLFCDPDIIDFPFARIARQPLARLISTTRARHVRQHYAEIGGRSPIRQLTERQARGLEAALAPDFDARCFVAMRYWHPLTKAAVDAVRARFGDASVGPAALIRPHRRPEVDDDGVPGDREESQGLRVKRIGDTQWGPVD